MSDLDLAPPAFNTASGDPIAFIDLRNGQHTIDLSIASREARVRSDLDFATRGDGRPAFDLGVMPTLVELDGQRRSVELQNAPDGLSDYKVVAARTAAGDHRMHIEHDLHALPESDNPLFWQVGQVHCVLNMSDLSDSARFLADFLPSNLEYDHYQSSIRINVQGAHVPHVVVSNGRVSNIADNEFQIEFPSFFTPAFHWIHVAPQAALTFRHAIYRSVDGRDLRIGMYAQAGSNAASRLDEFEQVARSSIRSLEGLFGPFPYENIWILGIGLAQGGMEYAGATSTHLHSLRHELDHSYFARCIAPASGDAGWIDEAIASWGDAGYRPSSDLPTRGSDMGRRSPYERSTSRDAYTIGRDLLAYIDHRFRDQGGLKPALKRYFDTRKFQSTTTPAFKAFLESSFGAALDTEFDEFVFGQSPLTVAAARELEAANPHHFSDAAAVRRLLFPESA